ncbi:MAG: hypothetical protein JXB13_21410 [Phycisphaerae bacterium]|nr:hypothetical protein [Phycisphaerae bacterium]
MTVPQELPQRWQDFHDLPYRPEVSVFPDRAPRVSGEDRVDADAALVCPRCKYSMRGIVARYCPECGFILEYEPVTVFAAASVSLIWTARFVLNGVQISNMVVMGGCDPFTSLLGTESMPHVMVPMKFYHEAVEVLDGVFGGRCFPLGKEPLRPLPGQDWICPACKEANPGTFEVCWHCCQVRPTDGGAAGTPERGPE